MCAFRKHGSKSIGHSLPRPGCVFVLWKDFLSLFIPVSAGATESVQMPSVSSKTLRKPAVTYQGRFDLPPVALGEWLET